VNIERCCACDDPTGKAGPGDDSLYTDGGVGPFCDSCYTGAQWADAELSRLRSLAARAENEKGMAVFLAWQACCAHKMTVTPEQYWNSITNNDLREEWRSRAIAVAAYLKEGK